MYMHSKEIETTQAHIADNVILEADAGGWIGKIVLQQTIGSYTSIGSNYHTVTLRKV